MSKVKKEYKKRLISYYVDNMDWQRSTFRWRVCSRSIKHITFTLDNGNCDKEFVLTQRVEYFRKYKSYYRMKRNSLKINVLKYFIFKDGEDEESIS